MSVHQLLEQHVRDLHFARFKEFEAEVVRKSQLRERSKYLSKVYDARGREVTQHLGIDPKILDKEIAEDGRLDEEALKVFLAESRPKLTKRRSSRAVDARDANIRTTVLTESGHSVYHAIGASIFATNKLVLENVEGDSGSGAIDSGWVFPDDPSRIRIRDDGHVGTVCFEAYASPPPPEFFVHFGFIPATTRTYEMTAVLAFHGFLVLRSSDSWWNCRHAFAKLKVEMNVHQYLDLGWKSFPLLIDRSETNVEEISSYDRTNFFDYRAVLRAGDPVVVTIKGTLDALGVGGHTYAELNFEAGTANYIEPLLLSVLPV